jgi:antitoxin HigA-1
MDIPWRQRLDTFSKVLALLSNAVSDSQRRAVSPDTALRLARYFGTTAQFWINLQASYDLK